MRLGDTNALVYPVSNREADARKGEGRGHPDGAGPSTKGDKPSDPSL